MSSCQCVWFCGLPGTLTAVGLTWLGLGQPGVALLLVGELVVAEETSHGRLDALGTRWEDQRHHHENQTTVCCRVSSVLGASVRSQ